MAKKWLQLTKDKILIIAFLSLGGLSYLATAGKDTEAPTSFTPAPPSVDTFIPAGYVLVPIEIANAESLSSLVGDVGAWWTFT